MSILLGIAGLGLVGAGLFFTPEIRRYLKRRRRAAKRRQIGD